MQHEDPVWMCLRRQASRKVFLLETVVALITATVVGSPLRQALADTPTETFTPTETSTPTPTATPPPGCAYFVADASVAQTTIAAALSTDPLPPNWLWCKEDLAESTNVLAVGVVHEQAIVWAAANLLLRWDSPPQPSICRYQRLAAVARKRSA
ncbi:MAG: hypothetical protein HY270_23445 [Deltaproteobacteria bacterium]|nr:hypothetical protein [Deltaproteobacteria bacterium]